MIDLRAPDASSKLELWGEGRDWIIRLPRDRPFTRGLAIDGRNEARNVVIIGGAIIPQPVSDLKRTTLLNGAGHSVYAVRGFRGATGGTFRVQVSESGAFTDSLPWDATPARIRGALDSVLGTGAVRAVVGSEAPGGPWSFVPADQRLGRVNLDLSQLTGAPTPVIGENFYEPASGALSLKDIRGTVHLEGLHLGGEFCDEGIDVQTPYADSTVQLSSCHIDVRFFRYNNDWQHPDAMQCYLGPASLAIERSDLITFGTQSLLGQPRQTHVPAPLELLRDWWFEDVLFQARYNPFHPTTTPGTCCYAEDNWPRINYNSANWHWDMARCYASRLKADGTEDDTGTYLLWWNHYPLPPPPGLKLRQTPPSGMFTPPGGTKCGPGYQSPGYTATSPPLGTARLKGNQKLT